MFRKEVKGISRMHIRVPNANVVFYGVVDSIVTKDVVEKAVLLLSDKDQLLNCHIETDKNNKVWFVIGEKLLPEVNVSESNSIDQVVIAELKHRFDLENGLLIRFTLMHQPETTLIINCHHSICDGMSLVYLFKDTVSILSDQSIQITPKTPVFLEPENLPQRVGNPISRFFIGLINRKWGKQPISFSDQLSQEIYNNFWEEYEPQIVTFKFSKELTSNIISQCKQNNVTVNTGLVTAFLYAEEQLFEPKDYSSKVLVTNNLRSHLKNQPGETMGYFASTLRPNLEYSEERTFWENARIFHNKIQQILKEDLFKNQLIGLFDPTFLDVMMLNQFGLREDWLARRMIETAGIGKLSSTFTIANLGKLELASSSEQLRIEDLFGPMAVSSAMEKYISALTVNDELHLSICFNEHVISRESILDIKDLILRVFEDNPRQ